MSATLFFNLIHESSFSGKVTVIIAGCKDSLRAVYEHLYMLFPDLLSIAPGLDEGMTFDIASTETEVIGQVETLAKDTFNLADIFAQSDDLDLGDSDEELEESTKKTQQYQLVSLQRHCVPFQKRKEKKTQSLRRKN